MDHSSTVEDVLLRTASAVGFPDASSIVKALEQQYVMHAWQLPYIGDAQWMALGVPIGVSAAVQHIAHDFKHGTALTVDAANSVLSPTQDPVAIAAQWMLPMRAAQTPEPDGLFAVVPELAEPSIPQFASSESASNRASIATSLSSAIAHAHTNSQPRTWKGVRKSIATKAVVLTRVFSVWDWLFPFDHHPIFKRAIIHAKTGAELREHARGFAEQWVVIMALLLNTTPTLWSMYPTDVQIPAAFSATFNCLCCVTCYLSGLCSLSFAVVSLYSSAVDATNFKHYMFISLQFWQVLEGLLIAAGYTFMVVLIMLMHAKSAAILSANTWTAWIVSGSVVGCILVPIVLFIYGNLNFVGRVIFHGQLIGHTNPLPHPKKSLSAVEAEAFYKAAVMDRFETGTNDVLDIYSASGLHNVHRPASPAVETKLPTQLHKRLGKARKCAAPGQAPTSLPEGPHGIGHPVEGQGSNNDVPVGKATGSASSAWR